MGENICKQSNQQRINFIQMFHTALYQKNKQRNLKKRVRRSEQIFLQRRQKDGHKAYEKMLNIAS